MRRFTKTLIMVCAAAACVALVAPAAGAAEAKPIRALVVTGGHDYDVKEFPKVFEGREGITAVQAPQKDSTVFDSIDGWAYDAIVLYNFAQGINEKQQANLLALLDKGVGLVILHHAVAAYPKWPEYRAILGGRYYLEDEEENGVKRARCTYLHDVDFKVHVEDPNHPVTRGLTDFEIHDETYHGYTMDPKVKVLLTTDEKTSEKAIAWCHTYKKAKVCFIQLGHDAKAYANPAFPKLIVNAIRWVAGREAAPAAPAPAAAPAAEKPKASP